MEPWAIGLVVLIVVGLGVLVFGALRDRRTNERRRREMLAPPERAIPGLSDDAPTPAYLSGLQARRPPHNARSTDLDAAERLRLQGEIEQPGTTTVDVGYASPDLITDRPTGWAVLPRPDVLVAAHPVSTVRELLGVLENQVPTGRPLVVVAPGIGPELIDTFAVNHLQQVISIVPVIAPTEQIRHRIAAVTGATEMPHADLQSGYLVPGLLGSCTTWISTPTLSHLITSPASSENLASSDNSASSEDPAASAG
ncbi:MAG: hypothetical protein L0H41_04085 [Microlunatus sp.]|nr:hypothetical protein [Microlunatus sp.]